MTGNTANISGIPLQRLLHIDHQLGEPLKGERVGPHGLGMATVPQAFCPP